MGICIKIEHPHNIISDILNVKMKGRVTLSHEIYMQISFVDWITKRFFEVYSKNPHIKKPYIFFF